MLYGIEHDSEPPFRGISPVQLAHNEAMRQHQQAISQRRASITHQDSNNNNVGSLPVPKVRNVSSGTLGSPFNEQQQQTSNLPTSAVAEHGTNAIGIQTVPIVKQPIPKKSSSRDRTATIDAAGKGRPDNKRSNTTKQVFPSKIDTSMNSSNATLSAVGQTAGKKSSSSRNKKPPVSNATRYTGGNGTVRGRKASDASERSVKKDDLLDRLADALK